MTVNLDGGWPLIRTERRDAVHLITLDRPERRNAVDGPAAKALTEAFVAFDSDRTAHVAVVTGAGGVFCAGNDLKAMAAGEFPVPTVDGPPPMGPTRMRLNKPVIAAIEGIAAGGGMELALWCDLRVVAEDAAFGLLNLPKGLPCLDGGSVRLPRLVGEGHALDLLLTGRRLSAREAAEMGLVTRLVPPGQALERALGLAAGIAALPQPALRAARGSALDQWGRTGDEALAAEVRRGLSSIPSDRWNSSPPGPAVA
jgi:enoyl-CoA hydratase